MDPQEHPLKRRREGSDVYQSEWGVCDNEVVFGKLGTGCLEKGLIFRNLNLEPWYTDEFVSKNNVGMEGFYGICFISSLRERTDPFEKVLAIAEAIMPGVPDELFLAEAEAREEFAKAIQDNWKYVIANADCVKSILSKYTHQDIRDCFEEHSHMSGIGFGKQHNTQTQNIDKIRNIKGNLTPTAAMSLLRVIIEGSQESQRQTWRSWIGLAMLSCAKRGQVTSVWIENFCQQTYPNFDTEVPGFDGVTISLIYEAFNGCITEKNAEKVFKRWGGYLHLEVNGLRKVLLQTKGAGLTALETIIRAIRDFQDFPWKRIEDFFPTEFQNFLTAVKLVNGNRHYGFKKNLGPACGSLFCNIAWVAKTLEVSINKDVALNDCEELHHKTTVKEDARPIKLTDAYVMFKLHGHTLSEPLDQNEKDFAVDLLNKIECYGPLN